MMSFVFLLKTRRRYLSQQLLDRGFHVCLPHNWSTVSEPKGLPIGETPEHLSGRFMVKKV
ncbi:hypothetical protein AtNW77_Chr4g0293331 [Arabidopsis thaliana]